MFDQKIARRTLLKGALASLAAIPVVVATRADAAALDPNDPSAKALGYVADTTKVDAKANPMHKPEQKCSNCMQFKGAAGSAAGPCGIFPGKEVSANGWCKAYAKKAG
jgi:hypothetical protein